MLNKADRALIEAIKHAVSGHSEGGSKLREETQKRVEKSLKDGANIDVTFDLPAEYKEMQTNALHAAISVIRDEDLIQFLLEKGANPNSPCLIGYTPLMHAIGEKPRLVKSLLEFGADPNITASKGQVHVTALLLRSWRSGIPREDRDEALDIIKLLVEKKADIKHTDSLGRNAIDYARRFGSVSVKDAKKDPVVKYLLKAGLRLKSK